MRRDGDGRPGLVRHPQRVGRHLQQGELERDVARALQQSGLAPANLVIELTESTMMHNTEANLQRLRQLKALGVRLAIDDFDTGYSSLAYLHRFPIDVLKIDRSFVLRLVTEGDGPELARAVVSLGDTLGIDTIAEGVESQPQADALLALGCIAGQGFLFSASTPLEQMASMPFVPPSRPLESPDPRLSHIIPSALQRRPVMADRRTFIGQCARGAVGIAVSGLVSSRRVLGANDRVRFGLIGCGSRGKEIFQAAMRSPNAEAVAAADVYTRRLDEVKALAPAIKPYKDFRQLLDDKNVDAVLIATPQHQHALNFVPAIQAGKDVYQEKTMAFSPDHAKRMRKALDGSGRVVQVGIQMISGPGIKMVREYATPERMGVITAHPRASLPQRALRRLDARDPDRLRHEPRRLECLPGRSRAARLRSAAVRELALLLGLLRRQRLREHGPPGRLLAHRAEPQDPACRDHDRGPTTCRRRWIRLT